MKKDIHIPNVEDVYIAIAKEYNTTYDTQDWNAYIINNKPVDLELVIIVSHGYSSTQKTATFRKKLNVLPKKSYAKIELLQEELFALNNTFKVSFFVDNVLYDKSYTFQKHTINDNALQTIPLMDIKGVLCA